MSEPNANSLSADLIDACRSRQRRLRATLSDRPIDALIVSNPKDICYLTGFPGEDSLLLVPTDGPPAIITDSRFDEALNPWRDVASRDGGVGEVHIGTRHRLQDTVKSLSERRGFKHIALQAEHVSIADRGKYAQAIGEDRLVDSTGLVGALRMCKDDLEIAAIEKAIDIQQRALAAALPQLSIGMSEREFCALLEYEMKCRGADKPSFDIIIGAGSNSSIIHHHPGERRIESGVLLIDWGCVSDGYCGDLTRTFGIGEMPQQIREIYAIVHEAQLKAIEACRPGRMCAEIDKVSRDVIADAGYGSYFGHGLGHGLGIDVHEEPYFNSLQTNVALEPGMVMTVEPGIYLPGTGGVRIEDDVLITEDGARVLSSWPKGLDDAIIAPAGTTAATA